MKKGLSTARKYSGRPANIESKFVKTKDGFKEVKDFVKKIPLSERIKQHQVKHPNDDGVVRIKNIHWRKLNAKDKLREEFYKTHIWEGKWVSIGGEEE